MFRVYVASLKQHASFGISLLFEAAALNERLNLAFIGSALLFDVPRRRRRRRGHGYRRPRFIGLGEVSAKEEGRVSDERKSKTM